tara:strand:+ start:100 stop:438 length:339 start_codon:yes stop_codon:yes gene_type:complete
MNLKKLLISLLLMPSLAFGADEPSQEFLDTLASAEQGDVNAQFSLGVMYENGRGVPQNNVRAYVWWSVSAAQGDESARTNRDIIAKSLTPAQLAQAQDLVIRCFRSDFQDCE